MTTLKEKLVLFGGDTYSNDQSSSNLSPGLIDETWGSGYKNDVWSADGTNWLVKSDIRLRGRGGQKLPQVKSQFKWNLITPGVLPSPGVSYDDWIVCEPYFNTVNSLRLSL